MKTIPLLFILATTPTVADTALPIVDACTAEWEADWPPTVSAEIAEHRLVENRLVGKGFAIWQKTGIRSPQTFVCQVEGDDVKKLSPYLATHGRQTPRNELEAIGVSCARLWEQSWPHGYVSEVANSRIDEGRYVGDGFAIHDKTHIRYPYRFFCRMARDGTRIDRIASYVAIRAEQFQVTLGQPAYTQNPQLPYEP